MTEKEIARGADGSHVSNLATELRAVEEAWTGSVRRTRRVAILVISGISTSIVVVAAIFSWAWLLLLPFLFASMATGLDRSIFEMFGLLRKGLLPSRPGWMSIEVGPELLLVSFRGRSFDVPVSAISGASWTLDDGWVGLRGIDDVLRISVKDSGELIVPESAVGYADLRRWLDERLPLQRIRV